MATTLLIGQLVGQAHLESRCHMHAIYCYLWW